eukprot:TRINITY_DN7375_c0_g1_i6.p1 TRINITY_DN7375_c0_g1~~TRINITY_DN7375_c0_g1_i6.p1  ORF type:complete len:227 (+),score=68.40 TRINITY_DN7375_c0_g1_i6:57-737(+)
MADPAEAEAPYKLIDLATGNESISSRDFTGRGLATYANNDTYEGEYVGGLRHGKGKYKWANGDEYDGEYQQNKKFGIGKMTYVGKGEYYGFFENGRKHGEGMYTYPNKDIYSGFWKFGAKTGQGTYVFADTGMKFVGEWSESKFIRGKWIYPNGTYYEGDFENNKPKGKGRWFFKNGTVLEGHYTQETEELQPDDGDETKVGYKLMWYSSGKIHDSAALVNSLDGL